jgi:hypothetical protein
MPDREPLRLESALDDMAMVRTTFETLDYFPDDEPMRRELFEIIEDARQKLAAWLEELRQSIAANARGFYADFDAIRDYLLEMMRRGHPGRSLDSMMRLDTYGEAHFFFPHPEGMDPGTASDMTGPEFFDRVLKLLCLRVTDRATCVEKPTFDRMVFQPYIAIMFAYYATTDPMLNLPPRPPWE